MKDTETGYITCSDVSYYAGYTIWKTIKHLLTSDGHDVYSE